MPGPIDFSLLTDGLRAEREQGITIDVAYRYFSTPKRKFIIADTPGHEQYTRNMVTGASTAELAIILVDARKGLLPQSRRHAYICVAAGASARGDRGKQDGPGRLRAKASLPRHRRPISVSFLRNSSRIEPYLHSDQRAGRRQRRHRAANECPGFTGRA